MGEVGIGAPTIVKCSRRAYRAISENMSRSKIGQQSLFLIVFKMAALLVKMHETVKDYIDSSEN